MNENSLKNLEKGTKFTAETARENGRKGAEKSNAAQRRKKTAAELAAMMLESALTDGGKNVVKKLVPGMVDDDLTLAAAMVAGQAQAAIKGNTSAYLALTEQAEMVKAKKEAEAKQNAVYHMDMEQVPDNFHRLIRDIRRHDHQQYVIHGGRGSMKSSTVAMEIPELMINNKDVHAVVDRKSVV